MGKHSISHVQCTSFITALVSDISARLGTCGQRLAGKLRGWGDLVASFLFWLPQIIIIIIIYLYMNYARFGSISWRS